MNVITIPKALAQQDDLVVVPRREYETLVSFHRERKTHEVDPDTGWELSERAKRRLKRARRGGREEVFSRRGTASVRLILRLCAG